MLTIGVEDTFTDATAGQWRSLTDVQVGRQVYETLIDYDERLRPAAALAESWQVSRDGRAYQFRLRRHAVWHDGRPVTARDIAANFRNRFAWLLGLSSVLEKVEIDDPRTLTVRLRRPLTPLLDRLTSPAAVTASMSRLAGRGGTEAPYVGTGCYRLAGQTDGAVAVLKAHDAFGSSSTPRFSEVRWAPRADGRAMWYALVAGEVDAIYECPYDVVGGTVRAPDIVVEARPSLSVNMLVFNLWKAPTADVNLRRAVTQALDKDELLRLGNRGIGDVAHGPVPPCSPFAAVVPAAEPMPRRHRGAVSRRAGPLRVLATRGYSKEWQAVFVEQLARADIPCLVQELAFSDLMRRLAEGRFHAVLTGMHTGADPDVAMFEAFHSSGRANFGRMRDRRFDELVEHARHRRSLEERSGLYRSALQRLRDIVPAVFLRHGVSIVARRRYVGGLTPHPDGCLRLNTVYASAAGGDGPPHVSGERATSRP